MTRTRSIVAGLAVAAGVITLAGAPAASAATGHDVSPSSTRVTVVRGQHGATPVVGSDRRVSAGASYHGCGYGAVCVYPAGRGWNGDRPTYTFYSYGPHNIYGQTGTHRILDNQYGSHSVGLCRGHDGKGGLAQTSGNIAEGASAYNHTSWDSGLTPVNSLELRAGTNLDLLCHH